MHHFLKQYRQRHIPEVCGEFSPPIYLSAIFPLCKREFPAPRAAGFLGMIPHSDPTPSLQVVAPSMVLHKASPRSPSQLPEKRFSAALSAEEGYVLSRSRYVHHAHRHGLKHSLLIRTLSLLRPERIDMFFARLSAEPASPHAIRFFCLQRPFGKGKGTSLIHMCCIREKHCTFSWTGQTVLSGNIGHVFL